VALANDPGRYIDYTLPDGSGTSAGRDPLGPVMGRSIADAAALARQAGDGTRSQR
jgi:hypothetical protein